MIWQIIFIVLVGAAALACMVAAMLADPPEDPPGLVLRNPNQGVKTPPAVRRARAANRKAMRAHKRGLR